MAAGFEDACEELRRTEGALTPARPAAPEAPMERLRGAGEPLGADRVLEPLRRSADRRGRRSRPCPLRVLLQLRASAHIPRLSNTERAPCRPGGRLVPSAKGIDYPCCQGCVSLWMFTQSWIAGLACWWVGAEGFDTGIAKPSRRAIAGDGDGRRRPSASAAVAVAPSAEAEGRRTSNAGTGSTRSRWRGSASTADPASAARWPAPPSCA